MVYLYDYFKQGLLSFSMSCICQFIKINIYLYQNGKEGLSLGDEQANRCRKENTMSFCLEMSKYNKFKIYIHVYEEFVIRYITYIHQLPPHISKGSKAPSVLITFDSYSYQNKYICVQFFRDIYVNRYSKTLNIHKLQNLRLSLDLDSISYIAL